MNLKLIDVFAGLDEAVAEAAKLQDAMARFKKRSDVDELIDWLILQGLASAVEKIYSHVESSLYRITKDVDRSEFPKNGGWHTNLLRRMHTTLSGTRPAVLSDDTYKLAKTLCAFRHLERGIYGTDLNIKRVLEIAADVVRFPVMVRKDVERLERSLESE